MRIACALLLVWFGVHYGYSWVPVEHQATAFNIARSVGSLVLLGLVVLYFPSWPVLVVSAGLAGEEIQVVGCGLWWLISPWQIKPGDELCSSGLGIPLGSIGLILLAMTAGWLRGRHAAER